MVPYWRIGSYVCPFDALFYSLSKNTTRCALSNQNQDDFDNNWRLHITVDGVSRMFIFRGAYLSITAFEGDVFNLESKIGQTLAVTFDPPPDGYTPPR